MDAGGAARAAAAGEIRQRRQRGACAAVVVDQRAEGARADIVAADEAKPIEPLLNRVALEKLSLYFNSLWSADHKNHVANGSKSPLGISRSYNPYQNLRATWTQHAGPFCSRASSAPAAPAAQENESARAHRI
jgi:hypothetical protein